jgi:uncharacterized membrane protein YgdD (TMEM256/DUF423 family)
MKKYLVIASALMAVGVVLGALGAHALEGRLDPGQIDSFKTGVRYQVWHTLAVFIVQLIPEKALSQKVKNTVSALFILGIVFFSLSIYILSTRPIFGMEGSMGFLGPVTPIGGLILIISWIYLAVQLGIRKNN